MKPLTAAEKIATIVCSVIGFLGILALALWFGWLSKTSVATLQVLVSTGSPYSYKNLPFHITSKKITTAILDQSDATNDGHPLVVDVIPSCVDDIMYELDDVVVNKSQYQTVSTFNASTRRQLSIMFPSNAKQRSDTCTVYLNCDACVASDSLYVKKDPMD